MTLSTKLIAGALGLVITGTGAIGSRELLTPKDIKYHLLKDQKTILDTTIDEQSGSEGKHNYQEWMEIINKYQSSESEIKTFADWGESASQEQDKMNKLKKKCESIMGIEKGASNFQDFLDKAKKYCEK